MKFNFVGQLFGSTGYARHFRSLVNAVYELGHDVFLNVPLPAGWELMVSDQELVMIRNGWFVDGVTVFIGQPSFWGRELVERCERFVGFVVWEGDRVPLCWLENLKRADLLLVPSLHVKLAIEKSFPDESFRICVVPHGVDTGLFVPKEKKGDEPFTFLANKGWSKGELDRGGVQFLLRAFAEEFGGGEDVRLKVKVNVAYCGPDWDLDVEFDKLSLPVDRPDIYISTSDVEYKEMPFYYDGDVFVSSAMAEGFNIPCLEALSCGVPVVATGFGGHTDFVSEDCGWLVGFDLVENTWSVDYEGVFWAQPRISDLRRILRFCFENRGVCKEKGLVGRVVAEGFTWRRSAEKLVECLEGG